MASHCFNCDCEFWIAKRRHHCRFAFTSSSQTPSLTRRGRPIQISNVLLKRHQNYERKKEFPCRYCISDFKALFSQHQDTNSLEAKLIIKALSCSAEPQFSSLKSLSAFGLISSYECIVYKSPKIHVQSSCEHLCENVFRILKDDMKKKNRVQLD